MILSTTETTNREDDETREWRYRNFLKSIQGTDKPHKQPNYTEDEVIFELEIKGRKVT